MPLRSLVLSLWLAGIPAALAAAGLTPLPNRPAAPELALDDLQGQTHRLSDYRGRVVVVNFWATWCPPCRAEMPSLQRAWAQTQAEGIVWLAVDVGEGEDQVFAFSGEHRYRFPILLDRDAAALGRWPVKGMPTTLVVDPQGRIAYRAIGGREWDAPELLAAIRNLARPATPLSPGATTPIPTEGQSIQPCIRSSSSTTAPN